MQTHRQIAKRKTVLWQVAAVAILGAAGAAVALPGVSNFFAPPKARITKIADTAPPPSRPSYDWISMAKVQNGLNSVGNPVAQVPVRPVVAKPTDDDTTIGSGPPPSTDWAYIGSIITPRNRHALVKVDGQQQIYSVGAKNNDTTLVVIEPDHIEVEIAGARKIIELAQRQFLTPNEAPKHPVAFRNPPNMLQPGGPGVATMMPSMARPNMPNPNLAGTMEQARAAQMAAAEAARRAQAPMEQPGIIPLEKLDAEEMQQYAKSLNDPGLEPETRNKYLSLLGIVPGTPYDQAVVRAKEAGIDLGSDAGRQIIGAIEGLSKGKR